ncbi:MAG: thiol peroxidase [Deltaproteobacteria bacterium]|nr:thiol peroxidase [Deltaproteobacteria bacterium]
MERNGVVTMKGSPLTLAGPELKAGKKAPDFTVLDKGLGPVSLKDFSGKIKLITVTPSLDTPVCDHQARRFNEEAAKLGEAVEVINISMDLPFAIGRFCNAAGIDRVKTLSDHRDASFGNAYGVLIKELRLLARAVFVIDANNTIKYMEIVPEMTSSVNFEKALQAAISLLARKGA